jgi:hypothetical protein
MGKRSDFERQPRDYYPTPMAAVLPLIPHLGRVSYVEPCAGNGALIDHLKAAGSVCVDAFDISPKRHDIRLKDAMRASAALCDGDYIITNPPWDRKILHPMIKHFSAMRPTWLLFDADWLHTKQSAPFMPYLRKIVSVGRVKWIPHSKMTGKDNCAWYLFDQTGVHTGDAAFHGRTATDKEPKKC